MKIHMGFNVVFTLYNESAVWNSGIIGVLLPGGFEMDSGSNASLLDDQAETCATSTLKSPSQAGRVLKPLAGGLFAVSTASVVIVTWQSLHAATAAIVPILWTLAPLLHVHVVQMALSAVAWSKLLSPVHRVPLAVLFWLRVIREAVDTMLPLAQVGGEMIASAALVKSGVEAGLAAGSLFADMVFELFGPLGFMTLGCLLLVDVSGGEACSLLLSVAGTLVAACAGLLALHRMGALKLVETLLPRLAGNVSATPALAIAGLRSSAASIFARRGAAGMAILLHFLHWLLGAGEVLIVLRGMGVPVSPGQAIIMNAIGVGARSAGFLVPGSLVVQESGFMLGATLAGLPPQSALVFSLMRRLRELAIGIAGIVLWRAGTF